VMTVWSTTCKSRQRLARRFSYTGGSTSKKAKFRGRVMLVAFAFTGFQRAATMGLFLVLFWCAAVARAVHRYYSRFGIPNSRFGSNKFPFGRLRELAGKGPICLPFSVPEWRLSGTTEKIPGSMGITGNSRPAKPAAVQPATVPIRAACGYCSIGTRRSTTADAGPGPSPETPGRRSGTTPARA